MTYEQTCPRCGQEFTGDDKHAVANGVVEHARVEHGHSLSIEQILGHLDGEDPRR